MYTTLTLVYFLAYSSFPVYAQSVDEVRQLAASLDQFSLTFLAKTSEQVGDALNLALSPYTIWGLLNILREGALGNTAAELEKTLGISPGNTDVGRKVYQTLGNYLTKTSEVTLDTTNALYIAADQSLKPDYLQVVRSFYNAEITPINFQASNAVNVINQGISTSTRGRILNFISKEDIQDAQVFLTSILFFKGSWQFQFNKTNTAKQPFYDERGNEIGEVDMMYDYGLYPFSLILDNKAVAVELPYKGNISMIVVLPKKNVPLQSTLDMLTRIPFTNVIHALEKSVIDFGEDPVHIYLPKFSIISDLTINLILHQMGIKDLFSQTDANLLGMFNDYLHVSRILQRAEIQVDEEGTVASAAAGASLQFKSPPARFLANKPFAYFIYDKGSGGIVFAGKFSNPRRPLP